MLAQLPRKPVFPQHLIKRVRERIEKDVQEEVIPVSTGIYSQQKLREKLQAIPKPVVVDYQDPIFYELAKIEKMPLRSSRCPLCGDDYNNKSHKPVQCKFCGIWNCIQCICQRKRYHPRAKDANSQLFDICHCCDDKFLSLSLHHSYVQTKCLLEELAHRVKSEKDQFQAEVAKREQSTNDMLEDIRSKKIRVSNLKKDKTDTIKVIKSLKKEKEGSMNKIEVKQKYLIHIQQKRNLLLQRKRQVEQWQKAQRQRLQREQQSKQISVGPDERRPSKQLSHTNVLSETIQQESQEYVQEGQEEQLQVPNKPLIYYHQPSQRLDNKQHFFNYQDWKKYSSKQQEGDLDNEEYEQTGGFSSTIPSPNLNNPAQMEEQSDRNKKIADIFQKEEHPYRPRIEQIFDRQSEDGEVIEMRKRELVGAAIKEYQRVRTLDEQLDQYGPKKKCECVIY